MFETPVLRRLRQGNSWGLTVSQPELHGECQESWREGEQKGSLSNHIRPPQTKTWLPLDFITQSRAIPI